MVFRLIKLIWFRLCKFGDIYMKLLLSLISNDLICYSVVLVFYFLFLGDVNNGCR